VRLERVEPPSLFVRGVDFVDGTPIIDIKPYVTTADAPIGDVRCGWLDTIEFVPGTTPASAGDPPK
jgi:tRNA (Thr-GGU) A37 N-methylase